MAKIIEKPASETGQPSSAEDSPQSFLVGADRHRYDPAKSTPAPKAGPDPYFESIIQHEIEDFVASDDGFVVLEDGTKVPAKQQLREDGYGMWTGGPLETVKTLLGVDQWNKEGEANRAYIPHRDPETGVWTMKRVASDLESLKKVSGSILSGWGPKDIKDNFVESVAQGIWDNLGVGTIELGMGAVQGTGNLLGLMDEGDWLDRQIDKQRIMHEVTRVGSSVKRDAHSTFETWDNFGSGIGSMVSSVLQFAVGGRAAMGGASGAMKLLGKGGSKAAQKFARRSAYMSAGSLINGGEAYNQAIQYGLEKDDAAMLAGIVGMANAFVEYKLGSNLMTDYLLGTRNASLKEAVEMVTKAAGGKKISKELADELTPKLAGRIMEKIKTWQRSGGARGVAAGAFMSGTEEGAEEWVQSMVLETGNMVYDMMSDDPEFGGNHFTSSTFSEAMEAAGLGAIMGTSGGSVASFNQRNRTIESAIANGESQVIQEAMEMLTNVGAVSERIKEPLETYVKNLTDLYEQNQEIFKGLTKKERADLLGITKALFDTEKKIAAEQESLEESINATDPAVRIKRRKSREALQANRYKQAYFKELLNHYTENEDGKILAKEEGYSGPIQDYAGELATHIGVSEEQIAHLDELISQTDNENEAKAYQTKKEELETLIKMNKARLKKIYRDPEMRKNFTQKSFAVMRDKLLEEYPLYRDEFLRPVGISEDVDEILKDGKEVFSFGRQYMFTNAEDLYDPESISQRKAKAEKEAEIPLDPQVKSKPQKSATSQKSQPSGQTPGETPPPGDPPPGPAPTQDFNQNGSANTIDTNLPDLKSVEDVLGDNFEIAPGQLSDGIKILGVRSHDLNSDNPTIEVSVEDPSIVFPYDLLLKVRRKEAPKAAADPDNYEVIGTVQAYNRYVAPELVEGVLAPVVAESEDGKYITYLAPSGAFQSVALGKDILYEKSAEKNSEVSQLYVMGTADNPLQIFTDALEDSESVRQKRALLHSTFNNESDVVKNNLRVMAQMLTEKGAEHNQKVLKDSGQFIRVEGKNGGIILRNHSRGLVLKVEARDPNNNNEYREIGYLQNPYGLAKRNANGEIELLDPETLDQEEFYHLFDFQFPTAMKTNPSDRETDEFERFIENWKNARKLYDRVYAEVSARGKKASDLAYSKMEIPRTWFEIRDALMEDFVRPSKAHSPRGKYVTSDNMTPLSELKNAFGGYVYDQQNISWAIKKDGVDPPPFPVDQVGQDSRYWALSRVSAKDGSTVERWIPVHPKTFTPIELEDSLKDKEFTQWIQKVRKISEKLRKRESWMSVEEENKLVSQLNEEIFIAAYGNRLIYPKFQTKRYRDDFGIPRYELMLWNGRRGDSARAYPVWNFDSLQSVLTDKFGIPEDRIYFKRHLPLEKNASVDDFVTHYSPRVMVTRSFERIYPSQAILEKGKPVTGTKKTAKKPEPKPQTEPDVAASDVTESDLDEIFNNKKETAEERIAKLAELQEKLMNLETAIEEKEKLLDKADDLIAALEQEIRQETDDDADFERISEYITEAQSHDLVGTAVAHIFRDQNFGVEDIEVLADAQLKSFSAHLVSEKRKATELKNISLRSEVRAFERLLADSEARALLRKEIVSRVTSMVRFEEEEMEDEDDVVNVRNYEKTSNEYSPEERMGRKIKKIIGSIALPVSKEDNHLYGWGRFKPVNVAAVYRKLVQQTVNKSPEEAIDTLRKLAASDRVYRELWKELYDPSMATDFEKSQVFINFLRGLELVSTEYLTVRKVKDSGWVVSDRRFARSRGQQLFSRWEKDYTAKNLSEFRRRDIASAMASVVAAIKSQQKEVKLQLDGVKKQVKTETALKNIFDALGFSAHKSFFKALTEKSENFELDLAETLNKIRYVLDHGASRGNLFTEIKGSDEFGARGRISKLAEFAAEFDDSLMDSSVLRSDNKTMYTNAAPNYISIRTKRIKEAHQTKEAVDQARKGRYRRNIFFDKFADQHLKAFSVAYAGDYHNGEEGHVYSDYNSADFLLEAFGLYGEEKDHVNFPFRIDADSSQLLVVRAPKTGYDRLYSNLDRGVDKVYEHIFMPEWDRITGAVTPEEVNQVTPKKERIFKYLDFFERVKIGEETIADKLRKEGLSGNEDLVKSFLRQYIEAAVDEFAEAVRKSGISGEIQTKDQSAKEYYGNYFLNHWLVGVSASEIFDISPDVIQKGLDFHKERIKRNKAAQSGAGISEALDFGKHEVYTMFQSRNRGVVGKSPSINTLYLEESEFGADENLDPDVVGDKKSNTDDAQVYISPAYKASRMEAYGRIDPSQTEAYRKLANFEPLTPREERMLDLIPDKTVYFDGVTYHKKSDAVITFNLVHVQNDKGEWVPNPQTPYLYNMFRLMKQSWERGEGIDQIVVSSALKTGGKAKLKADYFDADFESFDADAKFSEEYLHQLDPVFMRLQQENDSKTKKGIHKVTFGVQVIELLGAEMVNEEGKALQKRFNELIATMKKEDVDVLRNRVKNGDEQILADLLRRTLKGNPDPQLEELLRLTENDKIRGRVDLAHIHKDAEKKFFSMFKDEVLRSSMPGFKATLMSGRGFKVIENGEPRNLKAQKSKDGEFQYAEVMITRESAALLGIRPGDSVDMDRLSTFFGYRIPTQSHHSMLAFKVVGWLPDSYGDTIVVPQELPLIMGADFDVDSLFIFRTGTYRDNNGKLKIYGKENTAEEKWEAFKVYNKERKFIRDEIKDYLYTDEEYLEIKNQINRLPERARLDEDRRIIQQYIQEDKLLGFKNVVRQEYAELKRIQSILQRYDDLRKELLKIEDRAIAEVFPRFGYPGTLSDFSDQSPVNVGVVKNKILSTMLEMMEQPDIAESLVTPADPSNILKTKELIEKLYGISDTFEDMESYVKNGLHPINSIIGMDQDRESVTLAKHNVGIMANINSAMSFLMRNGHELAEPIILDGVKYEKFSVVKEDDIDEDGNIQMGVRRKKGVSSDLLTVATDDTKLRVSKAMNYNPAALRIAAVMVEMGLGERRVNLFINMPIFLEMGREVGTEAPVTVKSWLQAKAGGYGVDVYAPASPLTTEEIKSVMSRESLNRLKDGKPTAEEKIIYGKALHIAYKAAKVHQMATLVSKINKLNARVEHSSFTTLDDLFRDLRSYTMVPDKDGLTQWEKVFKKLPGWEPLQRHNLSVANWIDSIGSQLFFYRLPAYQGLLQQASELFPFSRLDDLDTYLRKAVQTRLHALHYKEKTNSDFSGATYLMLENFTTGDKKTIAQQYNELLDKYPTELGNNRFFQLTKPVRLRSGNFKRKADGVERTSNIALSPEDRSRVMSAFTDLLHHRDPAVRRFAKGVYIQNVLMHNSGFSGLGLLSLMPSEVFDDAVEALNTAFSKHVDKTEFRNAIFDTMLSDMDLQKIFKPLFMPKKLPGSLSVKYTNDQMIISFDRMKWNPDEESSLFIKYDGFGDPHLAAPYGIINLRDGQHYFRGRLVGLDKIVYDRIPQSHNLPFSTVHLSYESARMIWRKYRELIKQTESDIEAVKEGTTPGAVPPEAANKSPKAYIPTADDLLASQETEDREFPEADPDGVRKTYKLTDEDLLASQEGEDFEDEIASSKAQAQKTPQNSPTGVDKSRSFPELKSLVAKEKTIFTSKGVYTMRTSGDQHFGNPFTGTGKGKDTFNLRSVEKAVRAYEEWITGSESEINTDDADIGVIEYAAVKPDQREWIRNQIKNPDSELRTALREGKPLLYMNKTGYQSHADVLLKLVRRYENAQTSKASAEPSKTTDKTIIYTPSGQSEQTYTIRGSRIYNSKGEEVYKTPGKHRNRIFANLAVKEGRAKVVEYKGKSYVVNRKGDIISVTSGNFMKWGPENGDRNAIIALAGYDDKGTQYQKVLPPDFLPDFKVVSSNASLTPHNVGNLVMSRVMKYLKDTNQNCHGL